MVAGRPAQGEGGALAGQHRVERGERGLRRPIGALPGARRRSGSTRRSCRPEPGVDPVEIERPPPHHRPGIAARVALAPRRAPVLVRRPQEGEIGLAHGPRAAAPRHDRPRASAGPSAARIASARAGLSANGTKPPLCSSSAGAWASWRGSKKRAHQGTDQVARQGRLGQDLAPSPPSAGPDRGPSIRHRSAPCPRRARN